MLGYIKLGVKFHIPLSKFETNISEAQVTQHASDPQDSVRSPQPTRVGFSSDVVIINSYNEDVSDTAISTNPELSNQSPPSYEKARWFDRDEQIPSYEDVVANMDQYPVPESSDQY